MHTQEVYEHFMVSLVLNKKILGEIARDSFSEIIYVPEGGGISFQLELEYHVTHDVSVYAIRRRNGG